ncbi:hypothetical protein KY311_04980 [Candidatus Woesearchaeota archaeon]|nr:hypothetical protein [Candidatus Woesearchaeota archaeon]
MNKKGLEVWISWILLVGLTVALGVVMYSWYISTTESTIESLQYVYDRSECNNVAILLEACSQAQHLNINITNKLYTNVDEVIFRIHYTELDFDSVNRSARIKPGQKEDFRIPIDSGKTVSEVEALPVISSGNFRIICSSRLARVDSIATC